MASDARTMIAKGTFVVEMTAEPPFDVVEGVALGSASLDKRFAGSLEGTSKGQMLAARTPIADSAAYVAIERVIGALDGKRGTFVLVHKGLAERGNRSLSCTVAPDSATGELRGLSGQMQIDIREGKHFYEFEYTLSSGV
jgi:hypothetical protein